MNVLIALFWMSLGGVLTLFTGYLILRAAVRPVRYTRPPPVVRWDALMETRRTVADERRAKRVERNGRTGPA